MSFSPSRIIRGAGRFVPVTALSCALSLSHAQEVLDASDVVADGNTIAADFDRQVSPLLTAYCIGCHNSEELTAGIRLDHLDGQAPEEHIGLWQNVLAQLQDEAMPPEDERQPDPEERRILVRWVRSALKMARARDARKDGSVRRLTVAQYRNTLRDLLGLEEDLTDILPADAVSRDGFLNNSDSMILSPLLVEAYVEIAERALDQCIVDIDKKPVIQNFRVDFGESVNQDPCPDKLILGARSSLLRNEDFLVTEMQPRKPFAYTPLAMRTKYEFNEGYQGNDTVRGMRSYDSIYHAT